MSSSQDVQQSAGGKLSVSVERKKENVGNKKEQEDEELKAFFDKLELSLMDLMSVIIAKDKKERSQVFTTLKPPETISTTKLETLQKYFTLVDMDGNEMGDLLKHGELHVFGWIYSFCDTGLYRNKDEKKEDEKKEDQVKDTKSEKPEIHSAGWTTKSEKEFHEWLIQNWKKYRASDYSPDENNCLHFVQAALDFLMVPTPPPIENILIWIEEKGKDFLKRMSPYSRQAAPGASGKLVNISRMTATVLSIKCGKPSSGSSSPKSPSLK